MDGKEKNSRRPMPRLMLAWVGALGLLITIGLNMASGEDSSEEWLYTASFFTWYLSPIFIIALLFGSGIPGLMARNKGGAAIWILLALFFIFAAIPCLSPNAVFLSPSHQSLLSICWLLTFVCGAFFLFLLSARLSIGFSLGCCMLASVFLGLGAGEALFFFASDRSDKYVEKMTLLKDGSVATFELPGWIMGQCGLAPMADGSPYRIRHSLRRAHEVLYDVSYGFDGTGRRVMPAKTPEAVYDLLLFGCSFTFGGGLEDEETWPYQLSGLLGPEWKVENFAQNGYGAAQMLCLVEKGLIGEVSGKKRLAIFLAIENQLFRNEFFLQSPHYTIDSTGEPALQGKPRFGWIRALPRLFNGSELASGIGKGLTSKIAENNLEFREQYLGMIFKSSTLLRDKYHTQLIVLLWPDLEDLAVALEEKGIPVILAKKMLPLWDEHKGVQYRIHPLWEAHPNAQAASWLAKGLAHALKTRFADWDDDKCHVN